MLYRPITQKMGSKYLIEDYEPEKRDRILTMPMDAVFSSILFFYRLGIELSKTMMNYLENKEEKQLLDALDLQKNGGGIQAFSDSLEEILQDLKISPN